MGHLYHMLNNQRIPLNTSLQERTGTAGRGSAPLPQLVQCLLCALLIQPAGGDQKGDGPKQLVGKIWKNMENPLVIEDSENHHLFINDHFP